MQQTALKIPSVTPEDIPYLYQNTERVAGPPRVASVTFKSDGTFSKRFGKKVRDLGGRYTYCRGYRKVRTVHVPLDDLPKAAALIKRLVDSALSGSTISFRGLNNSVSHALACPVSFYDRDPLSDALLIYRSRLAAALDKGDLSRKPVPSAQQLTAKAHRERLSRVVKGLKAEGYSTAYGTAPRGGNVCLSLDEMERLLATMKLHQNL